MDRYNTYSDRNAPAYGSIHTTTYTNGKKFGIKLTHLQIKSLKRVEDHGYNPTKAQPSRTTRKPPLDCKVENSSTAQVTQLPELSLATSRRLGLSDNGASLNDSPYHQPYFTTTSKDTNQSISVNSQRLASAEHRTDPSVRRAAPALLPALGPPTKTSDHMYQSINGNESSALDRPNPLLISPSDTDSDMNAIASSVFTSSQPFTVLPSHMPVVSIAGTRQMTGLTAALAGNHPLIHLEAPFFSRNFGSVQGDAVDVSTDAVDGVNTAASGASQDMSGDINIPIAPSEYMFPAQLKERVTVACAQDEVELLPALALATHAALATTANHFLSLEVRETAVAEADGKNGNFRGKIRSRSTMPEASGFQRYVQSSLPPVVVTQNLPIVQSVLNAAVIAQESAIVPMAHAKVLLRIGADIAQEEREEKTENAEKREFDAGEQEDAGKEGEDAEYDSAAEEEVALWEMTIDELDQDGKQGKNNAKQKEYSQSGSKALVAYTNKRKIHRPKKSITDVDIDQVDMHSLSIANTPVTCAVTTIPTHSLLVDVIHVDNSDEKTDSPKKPTASEKQLLEAVFPTQNSELLPDFISARLLSQLLATQS